jgi:prophage regulatory protein
VQVLRIRQVVAKAGLSPAQIRSMAKKGTFPRPIKLTGYSVGWDEAEVDQWLENKKEMRDGNYTREAESEAL